MQLTVLPRDSVKGCCKSATKNRVVTVKMSQFDFYDAHFIGSVRFLVVILVVFSTASRKVSNKLSKCLGANVNETATRKNAIKF